MSINDTSNTAEPLTAMPDPAIDQSASREETASRVDAIKSVYAELTSANLDDLLAIYSENIVFVDPINEIRGRDTLMAHFRMMYQDVIDSRFAFDPENELIDGDRVMLGWNMTYRHKKLGGQRPIEVPGTSLLRINAEGVFYHRDWFDLGAMVYEQVPLLGGMVRALKRRLEA